MKIILAENYLEMSRKAADILCAQITLKPSSVLGLATGSTPIGAYQELVSRYQENKVSFSRIRAVNLDEYQGLSPDDQQSYAYFMRRHLFDFVNILPENCHIPNPQAQDVKEECLRYDRLIDSLGGIDLQLLGLGRNGHIGFNEPGETFMKGTHCVALSQSTIEANRRFFSDKEEVPRQALTVGMAPIMQARQVLLLVSGKDKAPMVKEAFFGPVIPWVPASILQLHKDVILLGDQAALSEI